MISKLGTQFIKQAVFGGLAGMINSSALSGEEIDALRKYYGTEEGAPLNIRNAVRGELGALAGSIPGALLLRNGLKHGSKWHTRIGSALGTTGYGLGALIGSQRYSKEHAKEVMDGTWDKFLHEIDDITKSGGK